MKRTLPWIVGGAMLCVALSAAVQRAAGQGAASWDLKKIEKSSHAPDDEAPKAAVDGAPTFLYLQIQLASGIAQPNLHQFRITDRGGKTVAEAYGWYEKDSRLVFENQSGWGDLRGLYLDGLGRRVPLVPEEPPKTPEPAQKPEPPKTPKVKAPKPAMPKTEGGAAPVVPLPDVGVPAVPLGKAVAPGAGAGAGPGAGGEPPSGGARPPRTGRTALGAPPSPAEPPFLTLYLSCGEDGGTGRIYQVDESGLILGVVHIPYVATGLAFHRSRELVAVMPRDGGRLVGIGDGGKYNSILWKDQLLIHPVDVAIAGKSDVIVVADDVRHVLAATSMQGERPQVLRTFDLAISEQPSMSVAASLDGRILYGSSKGAGVYRYGPVNPAIGRQPLLPEPGGVAADIATGKWVASQGSDQMVLFDGDKEVNRMRLPQGMSFYTSGAPSALSLLSFGPASSVFVAAQQTADPSGEAWFYRYETKDDGVRQLFSWRRERLWDFTVGPRMAWPKDDTPNLKSKY